MDLARHKTLFGVHAQVSYLWVSVCVFVSVFTTYIYMYVCIQMYMRVLFVAVFKNLFRNMATVLVASLAPYIRKATWIGLPRG